MSDLLLVTTAYEFAARKHVAQRRKGIAAEPYLNHLVEVASLLAKASDGRDGQLVAAGVLHDTLEDTDTTPDELEAAFGTAIAQLVAEVTDDKALPKSQRKRLQVEGAPKKSPRARMIKIADKTSNLRALAASPPAGWSADRKREYLEWAAAVVAGCRGVSPALEAEFDAAFAEARRALRSA